MLSIDNILHRDHDQVREREDMKNIATKTSSLAKQRLTVTIVLDMISATSI